MPRLAAHLEALGRVGGTLPDLNDDEARAVADAGGRVKSGRLIVDRLDAALRTGRIGADLWTVTEVFLRRPLIATATVAGAEAMAWETAASEWHAEIARSACPLEEREALQEWLRRRASAIRRDWNVDRAATDAAVVAALRAALQAPGSAAAGTGCPLPVFAQRMTGDPHGLDDDRPAGRLFLRAITARFLGVDAAFVKHEAMNRVEALEAAGLCTDQVSSLVTVAGLADGSPVVRAARESGAVIALPIVSVTALRTPVAYRQTVFAIENPAVFISLTSAMERYPAEQRPTLVLTAGHGSLASVILLGALVDGGATCYLSVDLDGGGLSIARRLARRLGDALRLWAVDAVSHAWGRAHGVGTAGDAPDIRIPPPWAADVPDAREAGDGVVVSCPSEPATFPASLRTLEACIASSGVVYEEALLPILEAHLHAWVRIGGCER